VTLLVVRAEPQEFVAAFALGNLAINAGVMDAIARKGAIRVSRDQEPAHRHMLQSKRWGT
jgi:hypothetical protein